MDLGDYHRAPLARFGLSCVQQVRLFHTSTKCCSCLGRNESPSHSLLTHYVLIKQQMAVNQCVSIGVNGAAHCKNTVSYIRQWWKGRVGGQGQEELFTRIG